jgi:glycosyltransferase involved in cell wall biosynthesis
VKRLKIFTWHIHGSYLYYLSQIPHDIFIPKRSDCIEGYIGITKSYAWPKNLYEIPFEEVSSQNFDCIIFQSQKNFKVDQFEVLSKTQRQLPRIYIEHDPPRESPTDTYHVVDDPNVLVVHVTDFNRLMWDNRRTPTMVIDHGVFLQQEVRYQGTLPRGLVVVNNIQRRGRRLGLDIFEKAREEIPLDYVGMGWQKVMGIGEIPHSKLPEFASHYRFFYNPIRYTSLGLSICEAMMVGLPIVGLATAELATVIENNVSGFISTRPQELVDAAKELIQHPELAKRLGEGARKKALERFSIQRFIYNWNQALRLVSSSEATWTSPS